LAPPIASEHSAAPPVGTDGPQRAILGGRERRPIRNPRRTLERKQLGNGAIPADRLDEVLVAARAIEVARVAEDAPDGAAPQDEHVFGQRPRFGDGALELAR